MLQFSLHHRWLICLIALVVFASTVPLFQAVGKDFFPEDDQSEFEITIRTAEGMSLQTTAETVNRITAEVRQATAHRIHVDDAWSRSTGQLQRRSVYVKLSPLETRSQDTIRNHAQVREASDAKISSAETCGLQFKLSPLSVAAANQNADFSFINCLGRI